jgi:hypothetical protein
MGRYSCLYDIVRLLYGSLFVLQRHFLKKGAKKAEACDARMVRSEEKVVAFSITPLLFLGGDICKTAEGLFYKLGRLAHGVLNYAS